MKPRQPLNHDDLNGANSRSAMLEDEEEGRYRYGDRALLLYEEGLFYTF